MVQPNDIITTNPITGQVEIVLINSQGVFARGILPGIPAGSKIETVGNFNGDFKSGLLVRN